MHKDPPRDPIRSSLSQTDSRTKPSSRFQLVRLHPRNLNPFKFRVSRPRIIPDNKTYKKDPPVTFEEGKKPSFLFFLPGAKWVSRRRRSRIPWNLFRFDRIPSPDSSVSFFFFSGCILLGFFFLGFLCSFTAEVCFSCLGFWKFRWLSSSHMRNLLDFFAFFFLSRAWISVC